MSDQAVRVERPIPAPAERIFDVLADPARHPEIDGSGTVRAARPGNPERLELGSRFGMNMRVIYPYRITNEVVEFEEGRRIAWRHFFGHRWRWELEPVEGGTKVTHTFDYSTARSPLFIRLAGYPERNRRGMEQTLERLDSYMTGPPA